MLNVLFKKIEIFFSSRGTGGGSKFDLKPNFEKRNSNLKKNEFNIPSSDLISECLCCDWFRPGAPRRLLQPPGLPVPCWAPGRRHSAGELQPSAVGIHWHRVGVLLSSLFCFSGVDKLLKSKINFSIQHAPSIDEVLMRHVRYLRLTILFRR